VKDGPPYGPFGPFRLDPEYVQLLASGRERAAARYLRSKMRSPNVADAIARRHWPEAFQFHPPLQWPSLLARWIDEHSLTVDELREIVPAVWVAAVFPICVELPQGSWTDLWREIGFYSNLGRRPPRYEITLYRGTTGPPVGLGFKTGVGMSWTTSRRYARQYAVMRGASMRGGTIWQLDAPPTAVLAVIETEPELDPLLAIVDRSRPAHVRVPRVHMNEIIVDPSYASDARMVERV
jgi:hypothetical protein